MSRLKEEEEEEEEEEEDKKKKKKDRPTDPPIFMSKGKQTIYLFRHNVDCIRTFADGWKFFNWIMEVS